jgi:hypothetical protein
MSVQCDNCKTIYKTNKGFWGLRNYHLVSGYFCSKCYDKVSHNSYGRPEQPAEYIAILLKQGHK